MESNHVSGQACKDFLILTLPLTYPLNEGFTGVKTAAFHNGAEKSNYVFYKECSLTAASTLIMKNTNSINKNTFMPPSRATWINNNSNL